MKLRETKFQKSIQTKKTTFLNKIKLNKPSSRQPAQTLETKERKRSVAVGVPKRKKEQEHRFCQYKHIDVDRHLNLVLLEKLPPKVVLFFQWIVSHCWDRENSFDRTGCTYGIASLARYFGVTKDTIGRYLSTLNKRGLLKTLYVVKNNGTGEVKKLKYKAAWNLKNEGSGWQIIKVENYALDASLRVGNSKTPKSESHEHKTEQGMMQ